jgi:hypothetical protein
MPPCNVGRTKTKGSDFKSAAHGLKYTRILLDRGATPDQPMLTLRARGSLAAFLTVAVLSSMSEQDLVALKLFGTIAAIVAVLAGLTALARRRTHQQFGTAHTAAMTAWNRAMFCTYCATTWVPGDPRAIGQNRVLGHTLLQRAKMNLAGSHG